MPRSPRPHDLPLLHVVHAPRTVLLASHLSGHEEANACEQTQCEGMLGGMPPEREGGYGGAQGGSAPLILLQSSWETEKGTRASCLPCTTSVGTWKSGAHRAAQTFGNEASQ
eukprot:scaffold127570_cov28-Tisochrysis_lutea.AAC.1